MAVLLNAYAGASFPRQGVFCIVSRTCERVTPTRGPCIRDGHWLVDEAAVPIRATPTRGPCFRDVVLLTCCARANDVQRLRGGLVSATRCAGRRDTLKLLGSTPTRGPCFRDSAPGSAARSALRMCNANAGALFPRRAHRTAHPPIRPSVQRQRRGLVSATVRRCAALRRLYAVQRQRGGLVPTRSRQRITVAWCTIGEMGTKRRTSSQNLRIRSRLPSPERETLTPCPACEGTGQKLTERPDGTYKMSQCRWCCGAKAVDHVMFAMFRRWLRLYDHARLARNCHN